MKIQKFAGRLYRNGRQDVVILDPCPRCGAAIMDVSLHEGYHEDLDDQLSTLEERLRTLEGE